MRLGGRITIKIQNIEKKLLKSFKDGGENKNKNIKKY